MLHLQDCREIILNFKLTCCKYLQVMFIEGLKHYIWMVCARPSGVVFIRTVGVLWPWNGCIIELYMAEPDQRRFTDWARLHALTLHTTVAQGSLPCLVPTIFLPPSAPGQEGSRVGKSADCLIDFFFFLQPWAMELKRLTVHYEVVRIDSAIDRWASN